MSESVTPPHMKTLSSATAPAANCGDGVSVCERAVQLPSDGLKIIAVIRISAILPNSFGSTWKPPGRENQACAPLTTEPSGVSTASRASRVPP